MRLYSIAILLLLASPAYAQFGIGLGGSAQCFGGMGPAPGSMSGMDQQANLYGRMNYDGAMMEQKKQILARLDDQASQARARMREVLNDRVIRAIDEHLRFSRNRAQYQNCRFNGSSNSGPVNLPNGAQGALGRNGMVPTSPEFCYPGSSQAAPRNTWWDFAEDGGRVSEIICDYHIPGFVGHPSQQQSARCKEGLREYYQIMNGKLKIENEVAQLDTQRRAYERGIMGVNEQMAEGSYCPYCGRGYAAGSPTDSILPMMGMLAMVGVSLVSRMNQPPMGGFGAPPGIFAGPMGGAFPGRPYPGMIPGYMGMNNGFYGAVPGGMGMGAFGCGGMGVNPYAMGNPYGMAGWGAPYMNGGASPWLNPYAAANPMMNPSLMNPLFMPGYGPGFGPVLGNGINGYNPYMPFTSMNNPLMGMGGMGSPYFQNPYQMMGFGNGLGPPMLPYMGYGLNPYGNSLFNNPFAMNTNPYGLGMPSLYNMNPYGNMGMGYNPYGMGLGGLGTNPMMGYNPMAGYGSPFVAGNPYGSSMMGYPGYGMGMGNSPFGMGGYNPYGGMGYNPYGLGVGTSLAPYGGAGFGGSPYYSPIGNYYAEIEALKARVQMIQGNPYFGSSGPPVLPFPGPPSTYTSPFFNSQPFSNGWQNPNNMQPR